jgi:hypothetical protein
MRSVFAFLCTLVLLTSQSQAAAELIQESTTHFRVAPLIMPVVTENLLTADSLLTSNPAWSFGLGMEVPVTDWLNSGFLIQFNTGLPSFVPISDLSAIAKFQWPNRFLSTGNFAPYILIPIGITYATTPVVDEIAKRSSTNPSQRTKLYDSGVGFNGSLLVGFEMFPYRYVGGYVEAGYKATILWHQIVKGPDSERTWQFSSYWIRGIVVSFGAKVAF